MLVDLGLEPVEGVLQRLRIILQFADLRGDYNNHKSNKASYR